MRGDPDGVNFGGSFLVFSSSEQSSGFYHFGGMVRVRSRSVFYLPIQHISSKGRSFYR